MSIPFASIATITSFDFSPFERIVEPLKTRSAITEVFTITCIVSMRNHTYIYGFHSDSVVVLVNTSIAKLLTL